MNMQEFYGGGGRMIRPPVQTPFQQPRPRMPIRPPSPYGLSVGQAAQRVGNALGRYKPMMTPLPPHVVGGGLQRVQGAYGRESPEFLMALQAALAQQPRQYGPGYGQM